MTKKIQSPKKYFLVEASCKTHPVSPTAPNVRTPKTNEVLNSEQVSEFLSRTKVKPSHHSHPKVIESAFEFFSKVV